MTNVFIKIFIYQTALKNLKLRLKKAEDVYEREYIFRNVSMLDWKFCQKSSIIHKCFGFGALKRTFRKFSF